MHKAEQLMTERIIIGVNVKWCTESLEVEIMLPEQIE